MDEELAGWAAGQYGRISQLRAEVTAAMAAGRYATAAALASRALELSTELLGRLSATAAAEALPYLTLAFAVRADAAAARAADGDPAGAARVLADPGSRWADAAQRIALLADQDGPTAGAGILAQRLCPHGRASYTGHCLARPPCPQG